MVQLKRHPGSFLVNNIAIHWWFRFGPTWSYKACCLVFTCLWLVSIVASFKVFCCNCYNKLVGHTETVRLNSIYKLQKQLYCFEIVWIKKFRHMRPWRQLDIERCSIFLPWSYAASWPSLNPYALLKQREINFLYLLLSACPKNHNKSNGIFSKIHFVTFQNEEPKNFCQLIFILVCML